jgi:MoaA/NifB/PqqE/SkfB family radical SAM enzyme
MKIIPNIPVVYKGIFPKNFVNDVSGWGSFSKQILQDNIGKLLSLDIDFGNVCTLNCPHCFRKNNKVDFGVMKLMDYEKIYEVVKQAKELGLRSVKFLGAGEPFENERFLEFLRNLKKLNIISSIFTKGHVIGDDKKVKKYYSRYGISTGRELIEELKKIDASILLGFNSFDTEIQDKMVGGVKGYTVKRNRALELLVEAGFNKSNPTHLCLAVNPVTNENYDDAFEIYKWGRVRNLYVIVCPTMISGRCAETHVWRKITPSSEKLIDLYTKIYKFNIEKGIQTLKQIKEEGVSSYAGGHPCNQIACGMYLTLTGIVLRCPGDDTTVLGSIWEESLKDIWLKSENYGRSGTFNCGCPPKWGKSIPDNLFTEVIIRLEKKEKQEKRAHHRCL